MTSSHEADLVVVGGGVAGTFGLMNVLDTLAERSLPGRRWRVVLFDREGDYFAGAPYGRHAGRAALVITALEDFLPGPELARFVEWLERHRDQVLAARVAGERLDSSWVIRHGDDIRAGRWRHLYVPRRLFGIYLGQRVTARLAELGDVVELETVRAAVTGLAPDSEGVRVSVAGGPGVRAARVLLAIGSPSVTPLPVDSPGPPGTMIGDIHCPSLDAVIEDTRRTLSALPPGRRKVLLVGANAEAIEVVYAAHHGFGDEWPLGHLTILSTRGRPPYWQRETADTDVDLPALRVLAERTDLRSAEIRAAVEAELKVAESGNHVPATVAAIMGELVAYVGRLGPEETRAFVARDGMAISDLLRQAGGDVVDALDERAGSGWLRFVAGRYRRASWWPASGWRVTVTGGAGEVELPDDYAVIINATGFETVTGTRDALLRSLVDSGATRVSASGRGLTVRPDFTFAERVHVLGPLLAGNADPRVWHLESASRIIGLARRVATVIADRLMADQSATPTAPADPAVLRGIDPSRG